MATPQQQAGQASVGSGRGTVSAAEVEKFVGGIDFPCEKEELIRHAREQGAPQNVLEVMDHFPDGEYGDATDVARGISAAKR